MGVSQAEQGVLHSLTEHSVAGENARNRGVAGGLRPARVSSGEDALGPEVRALSGHRKAGAAAPGGTL